MIVKVLNDEKFYVLLSKKDDVVVNSYGFP